MSVVPVGVAETFGQRLTRLRLDRGLSQRELAEGLDHVSYAFVSRLEAGTRTPSHKTLREIAAKLGTTAYYLETGKTKGRCPHCGSLLA